MRKVNKKKLFFTENIVFIHWPPVGLFAELKDKYFNLDWGLEIESPALKPGVLINELRRTIPNYDRISLTSGPRISA